MDSDADRSAATPGTEEPLEPLDQLLCDCLDQPDDQRARYLDELCRARPEHAESLRRRFALLERAGMLESSAPRPGPTVGEELPRAFGEFHLLRRLGRGGMGVVYLAEQSRLERRVALKLVHHQQLHFPTTRERFRREALAASRLDHPGICPVFDVGDVDGTPFMAMRYLEGETLACKIARAADRSPEKRGSDSLPLPSASAGSVDSLDSSTSGDGRRGVMCSVELVEEAAQALHVAHEAGLVHRDVKPGNIMVTPDGNPVLLDFGLARDEAPGQQSLTGSGDVLGTPAYMSPEQVSHGSERPDRRSDIYSLAVTLYQCLTLRLPFAAESRESLYRRILAGDAASPTRFNRHVPRDLRVVLEKAMDRDANRRYPTALEFAEDLRRVRFLEPIRARRASVALRLRRWTQRNPVAATLLVVLAAGFVTALLLLGRVRAEQRVARALALAGESNLVAKWNPMLSLLLAREAERLVERPETVSQLHSALARLHEVQRVEHGPLGHQVRFSPQGEVMVTIAFDRKVRVWQRQGERWSSVVLPHPSYVSDAHFSPDGKTIITAENNGRVTLWTTAGDHICKLPGHRGVVYGGRFSPGGSRILTHGHDGTARLWKRGGDSWIPAAAPIPHVGPVRVAAFSGNGSFFATGIANLSLEWVNVHKTATEFPIRVFDRAGRPVASLHGHEDSIADVCFSPVDENLLLSASFDRTARLWDVRTGRCLVTLRPRGAVRTAAFSPDGTQIVTASNACRVDVWGVDGRWNWRGVHEGPVPQAAFSPDGAFVVTGSKDGTVRLYTRGGMEFLCLRRDEPVNRIACSPDASLVAAAGGESGCVWRISWPDLPLLFGHLGRVSHVRCTKDGRHIVTSGDDQWLRFWSASGRSGRGIKMSDHFWKFDLSPDGRFAACIAYPRVVFVLDLQGTKPTVRIDPKGPRGFHGVVFSPRGERLAIADPTQPGRVHLTNLDGERVRTLRHESKSYTHGMAFSPAGDRIVTTGGWSQTAIVWRVETGEPLVTLQHAEPTVDSAAWSADGKRIVTTAGRNVVVWETASWRRAAVMTFPEVRPSSAVFSPVNSRLVFGIAADSVRLWTARGEFVAEYREPTGIIRSATVSPDGRRLYTSTTCGVVRSWVVDTAELRGIADRRSYRDFTAAERRRYAHLLGR